MKNKIIQIVFSGALLMFCSISFSSSGQATVDPGAGLNTGPAKIVDCAWWFTGNKKVCMSENTNPCTESDCF
ncbi:hypothetical protein [Belliella pelovolcani]|uniref:Secreted protein n=1 Tax=Belliella pelovolcani TaxID=529505 RepID=A0A1N7JKC2_9BACT|nr:hypothetical protein [Belliella pelovolcani]SIS49813.1 hypothetical protein SAMN05421761_10198 [Belliella pelovolcani]